MGGDVPVARPFVPAGAWACGCCRTGMLVLGNKKTAGLKWPAASRRMGGVVTARSILSLVDVEVFW